MRIWTLHPQLLDAKGLVALWRETLLAKHVLQGKTKGYKNHPQLIRFKEQVKPVAAIGTYLKEVYNEAIRRNYSFDKTKIPRSRSKNKITVTKGQVEYEHSHLLKKLKARDLDTYKQISKNKKILIHPMFSIIPGPIEEWEVTE